ncbi:MAG TPA: GFA family protein [Steroidobacteraceae bacterium]|nr:GFA family protein [Steroidobacteraceae bacterium]
MSGPAVSGYQGGCLCGAVRYKVDAEPLVVRACWCRVCQYMAAGNASINLAFPAAAVTITGELRDFPSTADSGNHMHRRFCPRCGVHVTSAADERPQLLVIRAGTLDDPDRIAPQMLIWTASAPHWAQLDASLPQHAGQAPPPSLR